MRVRVRILVPLSVVRRPYHPHRSKFLHPQWVLLVLRLRHPFDLPREIFSSSIKNGDSYDEVERCSASTEPQPFGEVKDKDKDEAREGGKPSATPE